jgi:hypothetical protein
MVSLAEQHLYCLQTKPVLDIKRHRINYKVIQYKIHHNGNNKHLIRRGVEKELRPI